MVKPSVCSFPCVNAKALGKGLGKTVSIVLGSVLFLRVKKKRNEGEGVQHGYM